MTQADGTRSWVARTRNFLIIHWIFGNISNCILNRLPVRERCQVNIAGQTYRLPERWGIICWDGMTSSANWGKGPSSSSTTTVPPYRCAFQVPSSRAESSVLHIGISRLQRVLGTTRQTKTDPPGIGLPARQARVGIRTRGSCFSYVASIHGLIQ